jgi:serine protease Do
MSVGVISALDRSLERLAASEDRLYSRLIETTAQINPGNSGGPLFDLSGHVIGINTAVILPQKQTNGVGFAIPMSRRLLEEVDRLEEGRPIVYGYLGVTVAEPTPAQLVAADVSAGLRVESTDPGSPAAGLLAPGDLLIQMNEQPVGDTDQFVRSVGDTAVGRPVLVDLVRDGKPMSMTLVPRRRALQASAVTRENQRLRWRGLLLGPLPGGRAGVVVIAIDDNSPMRAKGVRQGSVITGFDGHAADSLVDLLGVVNEDQSPPEKCNVSLAPPAVAVNAGAATQPLR